MIACAVIAVCAAALSGCTSYRTQMAVRSMVSDATIFPVLTVKAYIPSDRNTADVFLSDIPEARLIDLNDPLNDVAGNIVHLHIFLMPEAGQTPIDDSACNITVRHAVLTGASTEKGPVAGIYAGGGFCLPASAPGDRVFDGSVRDATMRLSRVGDGFVDRLGAARMSGSFAAPRNDQLARAISQRLESISRRMSEVAR